jgi:hypothetical protein
MTKRITLALSLVALFAQSWGQSNPTAQTLPYSQNFSTFTGATTVYPAGIQGWGIAGSLAATYPTTVPNANQALAGGTNATTAGGVYDMNGKMGILSAGSNMKAICLALNTTGSSNITLAFDAATQAQTSGARINEIGLQYRLNTSATFTNIATGTYTNNGTATSITGITPTNISNISLTLPSACDNQALVQLRWVIRDVSGTGNRASFSIDNISVTASSPTVAIIAQDPNSPTAVNWPIGGSLNPFYQASVTASGGNAVLSSVTANMSGTYMAADISAAGLKLYYSSDATLVPAGDVVLNSQSSTKSGATENITWTGFTQTITAGSTGYIYATADVSASATSGRTLAGSFTSNANIVCTPTVNYNISNTYGATTDKTFLNLPTNPTIFAINCSSEAKINIDMNAPSTGTVLVFANTTGSFTTPTGAGTSFTGANSNYSSAPNYPAVGGNLIYSGSGTNMVIQGVTAGQNYSFKAYSYNGSSWSSGTAVISASTVTQPVSSVLVSPSPGQLQLTWNNPASTVCYNNVIIIARQASAVEGMISKATFDGLLSSADFTGANAVWTSNGNTNDVYDLTSSLIGTDNTNFLVYKGTGTSAMITGLTNGIAYHFRIFTVDGLGALARWSPGIDASGTPGLPAYYWNGGNIANLPANGGSGVWGTANAWRQPSASGSQATWANGNTAVFAGTAGAVTLDATRTATSYLFNTSSYTLQTASSTQFGLSGPITLGNNNELVLAPNAGSAANGVLAVESVTGTGTASITIFGNQVGTAAAARINLASVNGFINVPTNIVSATGTGVGGYVATATGAAVNGNITNNSSLTTCIGATSGFDITMNGVISGTSGLQFSAGASGGAGTTTLNNLNTYSGPTQFNAALTGNIVMGVNNALPPTGDVIMSFSSGNGGNLDLNGTNQSIGNLSSNVVNTSIITNNSSTSNSTLTINQTSPQSFGLAIKDGATGQITVVKNGPADLTLTRSGSNFSGLIINNGELRLSPTIASLNLGICQVVLNGGSLGTSGVLAGTDLSFSTLQVTDNSTIALSPSSTHTVVFAASNGVSWTSSKTLVITGWQGTYTTTTGSSGTTAQIFVGTSALDLTATQLAQIKFFDGISYYGAMLLSTGELVPFNNVLTQMQPTFCGYTATSFGEFLRADSVLGANYYRFQLVNTATSYTQTLTNSSGYPYLALYVMPGISYGTTYTVTVAWSADGVTYSAYGAPCAITSPTAEITQLVAGSCGVAYTSWTTLISAEKRSGVTHYRFQLTNASLGYSQAYTNTNKNFNFSSFTGLTASTPYTVAVAVELFGVWNPYGPSCTITSPPAIITTSMLPQYCGYTPSSYSELMTAAPQVGTSFKFKLENTALGYSQTFTNANRNVNLVQYSGLTAGTTYSISVSVFNNGAFGPYGPSCTVTTPAIPTTSMLPQYCGYTPSSYSELMTAAPQVGTSFKFKLENTSLGYSQTFTNTNRNVNLVQYSGLTAGASYSISVSIFYNGVYGPYGNVCQVTVPSTAPTTSVVAANCGYTPATYHELMNVKVVAGASKYEYKLENVGLGYSQTFQNTNPNFNFAVYTGLATNTMYTVSARVYFMGAWGPYGQACTVTTPASSAMMLPANSAVTSGVSAKRIGTAEEENTNTFDALAYPNPFNNEFAISLVSYKVNEAITIRVFDATGRLMEQHSVLPGAVKDLTIGSAYAQGLYNIVVSQGSQTKSIKVIRS